MEIVSVIAALALPLAAFFFWARGLIKSRRDDIVLGFSILVLICGVLWDRDSHLPIWSRDADRECFRQARLSDQEEGAYQFGRCCTCRGAVLLHDCVI